MGETNLLATIAGMSADALVGCERDDEAERFASIAQEMADPDDVDAQVRWRRARARLLARRRDAHAAERLARDALALAAATDSLNDHGCTLLDLAEVLRVARRPFEGGDPPSSVAAGKDGYGTRPIDKILEYLTALSREKP